MSTNPNSTKMTVDEYLEFERNSESKHEYINGIVRPVRSEFREVLSPYEDINHSQVITTLTYLVYHALLNQQCHIFDSQMAVEVAGQRIHSDISVVIGGLDTTTDLPKALLNPTLAIDVTTASSRFNDFDKKFRLYRQLATFKEYVMVSATKAEINGYYRNDANNIWEFRPISGLDSSIHLKSIDCTLSLADVYQNITFGDS